MMCFATACIIPILIIIPFNIPDTTTLKVQVAVRLPASVAMHVTVLEPRGKEPCNWLPLGARVIWVLVGDVAVQTTVGVTQSVAVGVVNETEILPPVDVRLMACCGHCVKVGGVVSGPLKM